MGDTAEVIQDKLYYTFHYYILTDYTCDVTRDRW